MKTSNKILLGLFAAIALNVLTGMVFLRSSLGPSGIGNGDIVVKGTGPLTKVKKDISEFEGLIIGDNFQVNLVQGQRFLEIEAQENLIEHFQLEVKDGKLWLEAKEEYTLIPEERILVTVGFEQLEQVEIYGNSNLSTTDDLLKLNRCVFNIHGLGKITLPIEAEKISMHVHGSGWTELSGKVEDLHISVTGSGRIEADKVVAKKADAHISGAGWVVVNVEEFLNAHISGSGSIEYLGNPKVRKHISGAGSISAK